MYRGRRRVEHSGRLTAYLTVVVPRVLALDAPALETLAARIAVIAPIPSATRIMVERGLVIYRRLSDRSYSRHLSRL
jgi:hypothetical protein